MVQDSSWSVTMTQTLVELFRSLASEARAYTRENVSAKSSYEAEAHAYEKAIPLVVPYDERLKVVEVAGMTLAHQIGPLMGEVAELTKEVERLRVIKRDVRTFPIQSQRGAHPHPVRIPWSVAELAYSVYSARFGRDQTLERLAQRGGFAPGEMDMFLPEWRKLSAEVTALREEVKYLESKERATELDRSKDVSGGELIVHTASGKETISAFLRRAYAASREVIFSLPYVYLDIQNSRLTVGYRDRKEEEHRLFSGDLDLGRIKEEVK